MISHNKSPHDPTPNPFAANASSGGLPRPRGHGASDGIGRSKFAHRKCDYRQEKSGDRPHGQDHTTLIEISAQIDKRFLRYSPRPSILEGGQNAKDAPLDCLQIRKRMPSVIAREAVTIHLHRCYKTPQRSWTRIHNLSPKPDCTPSAPAASHLVASASRPASC